MSCSARRTDRGRVGQAGERKKTFQRVSMTAGLCGLSKYNTSLSRGMMENERVKKTVIKSPSSQNWRYWSERLSNGAEQRLHRTICAVREGCRRAWLVHARPEQGEGGGWGKGPCSAAFLPGVREAYAAPGGRGVFHGRMIYWHTCTLTGTGHQRRTARGLAALAALCQRHGAPQL